MRLLSLPACMDAHTVMEEWEVSPFDGGYDGLRELQSRRFSGAVEAGGAWLFFRTGDPLAVVEELQVDPRPGSVDAFETAGGQVHEAPHPGVASLAAMLVLDGEVRGQYYTEDTPLSTVHETLSEGGFTGYVELSENVLSGDYYVVYEDGAEDYVGVLGSSQRLVTDDEAQSKAEGEIGVYSVVAVSYPDVEIPEPEPEPEPDPAGGVTAGGVDPSDQDEPQSAPEAADATDTAEAEPTDPASEPEPEPESDPAAESASVPDPEEIRETGESEPDSEPDPDPEPADASTGGQKRREQGSQSQGGIVTDPNSEPDPDPEPGTGPSTGARSADRRQSNGSDRRQSSSESRGDGRRQGGSGGASGSSGSMLDDVTTRAVPSLDPERTGRADSGGSNSYVRDPSPPSRQDAGQGRSAGTQGRDREPERRAREPEPEPEPEPDPGPDVEKRVAAVREEYESRIEQLESDLESLRSERDRLQQRVSELEAADAGGGGGASGPALSEAEALAGTSLFVREDTRGEATLEDAHAGRVDRQTLDQNLRIEYHTQFEDEGATVDGEPFETWLRSSATYDFVEWLIVDLLFEIQSTGSGSVMGHLYDALPEIDRIGFGDAIPVGDGQEGREIAFDVVARDRMGEPLVVANIDESRDPTRADSMQPLINDAEDVCIDHDTLAGTFAVTSSFFEPDALDAAREATSGSLLSREKYRSFVKLARKNGFHLCLVEAREESFHLAVPEL